MESQTDQIDSTKFYVSYLDVHNLATKIAIKCAEFKPDFIVAIGGGGLIPARIMRTILQVPILVITMTSYKDDIQGTEKWIQWLDYPELVKNKRILVVDELDDTGNTLKLVQDKLLKLEPSAIAFSVLHYKMKTKKAQVDSGYAYFKGQLVEDKWIVYPWE